MLITRDSLEKTLFQFVKDTKSGGQSNSSLSNINKIKTLFHLLYSKNIHNILQNQLKKYVKIILFLMNHYLEIIQDLEIEKLILIELEIHLLLQNMLFLIMIKHGLQELELKVVI